ncbi:hypothetical protein ASE14_12135 [Agromyces sp. Root81]|uniref:YjdF family protein n=1 Tax=Agromyces sp. Root81 TaxID=1736601 RepID=UPI000701BB61|nr:YjdF family protein [Agromyces sp. Root81]KRC61585.1 hypothetical protein ASE14_12135 [Agromyces sp. Root81]
METESTFTVYFDGTFWVGVLDIVEHGTVRAAKVVFGSEPTPAELWEFTRTGGNRLIDDAAGAPAVRMEERSRTRSAANPKRLARDAARQQRDLRATRSEAALAAAQEAFAKTRRMTRRERRDADAEHRRAALVAKRKAKHRGR